MKSIYENSEKVIVWLGPDTEKGDAEKAIQAIYQISSFLCETIGCSLGELRTKSNVYREVLYENRNRLPLPNESEFSTKATWDCLAWFYSRPYFNRVWVMQEINSNENRTVHCGLQTVEWERVELVAGYIILEPAFSSQHGFTTTHCWWAATLTTERIRRPSNWVFMLYLASNFSSLDPRDMIYGLRGLLKYSDTTDLLVPDYSKTLLEVYRDSVEAAFRNFHNADVLLYVTGNEIPSWIPRWDRPMLFRNPFRFGNALPWKPTGDTEPEWSIDRRSNALTVRGCVVGKIKSVEPYNPKIFGNAMLDSEGGERENLKHTWERILSTASESLSQLPLRRSFLSSAAMCFAFGLDDNSEIANESDIVHTFVAYLRLALNDETFEKYVPLDLACESTHKDGRFLANQCGILNTPNRASSLLRMGLSDVPFPRPR